MAMRAALVAFLAVATSACGSGGSSAPAKAGADAAVHLLSAPNFRFTESDHATSPIAVGNFLLITSGIRTQSALLGTVSNTAQESTTTFTLYATKQTYCHLGGNLPGGGGCAAGNGYDDYITFLASYYLRSIEKRTAHVTQTGATYRFSGSSLNTSTTPNVQLSWHGSFKISGGYLVELQYTQTGSEGAVQTGTITFTNIGTAPAISAPPGAPG
jgi:hypothetical protein